MERSAAAIESSPEPAPAKKRGRPPGSKNKPKEAAPAPAEESPSVEGNGVDTDESAEAMKAAHEAAEESPLAPDNLDIPPYLRRDQQSGSVGGAA